LTEHKKQDLVDHLFRHQFGKMVAILTRIFGLTNLETIEDAVQDTFVSALKNWRKKIPDNPEAWLTQAAKNRTIDLLRKIKADTNRETTFESGAAAIRLNDMFLEHEIEDSQLRMIFTACHPNLKPIEQIVFALKSISGFSTKEISSALLVKEATIKKRLLRARQSIKANNISFSLPEDEIISNRIQSVLNVIYLIFNEGFHSGKKDILIRKDLCGEAIRLCKLLLKKVRYRNGSSYSLFALLCIHAARLESKVNEANELVDIENQDRSKWYMPLVDLGSNALMTSYEYNDQSSYAIEAAIALEHLKAKSFSDTNWRKIVELYHSLYELYPSENILLNKAIVHLQLKELDICKQLLDSFEAQSLEQRAYLYHATLAKYFIAIDNIIEAKSQYEIAYQLTNNNIEKQYLLKQIKSLN